MTKKSISIFLINPKKEMLLQLRDNKKWIPYPGYWACIGGGIEEDESEYEAVKREIKEEIDCEIKNIKMIGKINIKKDFLSLHDSDVSIFKGNINIPANEIKLNEGQKVEFFKMEELLKLKIPNPLRNFILNNKDKILE